MLFLYAAYILCKIKVYNIPLLKASSCLIFNHVSPVSNIYIETAFSYFQGLYHYCYSVRGENYCI